MPGTNKDIPRHLLNVTQRTIRLPSGRREKPTFLSINKQLQLHIIRQQNVLASCDCAVVLSQPTAKLPSEDLVVTQLDTCFVYGRSKCLLILLIIGRHHFVAVDKSLSDDSLTIVHNESGIRQFVIRPDAEEPGQVTLDLTTISGCSVERSPTGFISKQRRAHCAAPVVAAAVDTNTMPFAAVNGPIVATMHTELLKARTELSAQRLRSEMLGSQLTDRLMFGPASQRGLTIDEKAMMARYGDVWTRVHAGRMVIGVPVYNCTFKRKRVLHNVRLVLNTSPSVGDADAARLHYTTQLFECQLDDSVTVADLDALLFDDELQAAENEFDYRRLAFEHEWHKADHLLPEMAAMLVATTSELPSFVQHPELLLNVCIAYDLDGGDVIGDGPRLCYTVQMSCGDIRVDVADVLFASAKLRPTFAPASCFKDLLTVAATSVSRSVLWHTVAAETDDADPFTELLVHGMGFVHVHCGDNDGHANNVSTIANADAMDVDRYIENIVSTSTSLFRSGPLPSAADAVNAAAARQQSRMRNGDIYYCARSASDGFDGMLVRRVRTNGGEHQLKLFGVSAEQMYCFVQCLRRQSGPQSVRDQQSAEVGGWTDLRHSVLDEMRFLRSECLAVGRTMRSAQDLLRKRTQLELRTDLQVMRSANRLDQ